jgi:hypothetical protein
MPAPRWGDDSTHNQFELPYGISGPATGYGLLATRHMHEYGTTSEQLAEVAVATRKWAALNPKAMMRDPISIKNRTVSEIRRLFSKHGGNLGETGCVGWMFDKKGVIGIDRAAIDEDRLVGIVLEVGAEDVKDEDDMFEVVTPPEEFEKVKERLEQEKVPLASAQVTLVPKNTVTVDAKHVEQILKLTEELEDHDDVQSVSANFNIPTELMEEAS